MVVKTGVRVDVLDCAPVVALDLVLEDAHLIAPVVLLHVTGALRNAQDVLNLAMDVLVA